VARVGGADARHVRTPWSLPSFAFATSVCFVLAAVIDPSNAFAMTREVVTAPAAPTGPPQTITVESDEALAALRSPFTTSRYHASAPAVNRPDVGTAQAIAYDMVLARGWDEGQYACLVSLWNRESHWNIYAENKTSGAYGIPQALPGDKMASVGADWRTNPVTQITWGLGYIAARYENPCGAWTSSEARGWY
jgi:hypothetical protein